nr:MAG TPA: protein of unknown function (DUF4713) [Caudoviricetes sp.]
MARMRHIAPHISETSLYAFVVFMMFHGLVWG